MQGPRYLPICLDLRGRSAAVIGAGAVALERVGALLACGARVTVIGPRVREEIRAAAEAGELTLLQRPFQDGDTDGAFLVVAATDDPAVNARVFEEARAADRLVSSTDDPEHSNYIFASRIERGPLTVSVFTHGTSPALSRRVRRELEAWLGPEYAELAGLLAALRPRVRALGGLTQPRRQRIYERIVYSEALLLFREGRGEEALRLADAILAEELSRAGGGPE